MFFPMNKSLLIAKIPEYSVCFNSNNNFAIYSMRCECVLCIVSDTKTDIQNHKHAARPIFNLFPSPLWQLLLLCASLLFLNRHSGNYATKEMYKVFITYIYRWGNYIFSFLWDIYVCNVSLYLIQSIHCLLQDKIKARRNKPLRGKVIFILTHEA